MAVQETASSVGKAGDTSTQTAATLPELAYGLASFFTLKPIAAGLALLLGAQGGVAQIIADPSAPGSQRPTVLNSANGVPTVNIQTPSAAGVSRNSYQQFDIGKNGAILNNSRTNVQTQLGGWIQGNPWLSSGTARVIVNEVNSAAQSRLMGAMEVAGQRADVIIANPSGLVVDGLSFINAAGVTLTTGRPVYGAGGSVSGLSVNGGQISIQGRGMDATEADYASILARAITVNAGVWAQDLRLTTGSNELSVDGSVQQSRATQGAAQPQFALDVAQLGGMYAGKIFIVGTEAGLGVRNAGTLSASAQRLTLTVDGQLSNAGVIAGNGTADLSIAAQGVTNSGTLSSQRDLALNDGSQGIINTGNLQAGRQMVLQAGQLTNHAAGTLDAQRLEITAVNLHNAGSIQQTGGQDLKVEATVLANTGSAAVFGASPTGTTTGGTGNTGNGGGGGSNSNGSSGTAAVSPSSGQDGSSIQVTTVIPETLATGSIHVAQSLENAGQLIANGATDVRTSQSFSNSGATQVRKLHSDGTLDNSHGSLVAQEFSGSQTTFLNRSGAVFVQSDAHFAVQSMDNTSGSIASAQALTVTAQGAVINSGGILTAGKGVLIQSQTLENNDGARIVSNAGNVQLDIADGLNNHKGQIVTASGSNDAGIRISTATLDNTQGEVTQNGTGLLGINVADAMRNGQGAIVSNGSAQIAAGSLHNDTGHISTLKQLGIIAQQDISNASGTMQAGDGSAGFAQDGGMNLQAGGGLNNQNGRIFASGDLQAQAHRMDNTSGSMSSLGAMDIGASDAIHNGSGQLLSDGRLDIRADNSLNNAAGTISSADKLLVSTGQLDNTQGTIAAARDITLHSTALHNQAGQIGAQSIAVDTQRGSLNNDGGKIIASQGSLTVQSGALSNDKGWLQASQDVEIDTHAQQLSNTGTVLAVSGLHIATGDLHNTDGGTLQAGNSASTDADLHIASSGTVTNTGGRMLANASVDLSAAQLDNSQGEIGAGQKLAIQAQTVLNNSAGKLLGNTGVDISSGSLLNDQQGVVGSSAGNVTAVTGALDNQTGTITAQGLTSLTSLRLDNTQGIVAGDQIAINTQGHTLLNTQGQILASDGDLTIDSGELQNRQGRIATSHTAELGVNGLDNDTGRITANSLQIQSHDAAGAWAAISNQGGHMVADQQLQLDSGLLNNTAGAIQTTAAGSTLQIDSHGENITNQQSGAAGGIVSAGDLQINTQSGSIDNGSAGYIGAYGTMELSGSRILNQGGNIVANHDLAIRSSAVTGIGIDNSANGSIQSTTNVQLHASTAEISNATGSILANNDLLVQSSGVVNNSQGSIKAGHNLAVLDANVASGAALASASQTLSNQGGMLFAASNVQIRNQQLSGAGDLQSQGGMQLAFANSYTHEGTLSVNHDLSVESAGDITNHGTIAGGDSVTVTGLNVNNQSGAQISSAGITTVNASQTLNNRGLIDGSDTRINAGAVNNIGTGRIYGDHVSIAAETVTNSAEGGVTATIAARQSLDIGAAKIENLDGSTILSLGDISIGRGLDAQRKSTGQADYVNNIGSKIDASANIDINSIAVNNNSGIEVIKQEWVMTRAGENLVQIAGYFPESASNYVELWDGTRIPYVGYSEGRIFKVVHPDRFMTVIPLAYQVFANCTGGGGGDGETEYCTYTYKYEPAGSSRFAQYGVYVSPNYNVTEPAASDYGAVYDENMNISWPRKSRQSDYLAAYQIYLRSISEAVALNDVIVATMKENNRIAGSWRDYTIINGMVDNVYRDKVLSTKPGQITAGGSINVSGILNNLDSKVVSGGEIKAVNINNRSTVTGTEAVISNGTSISYSWEHHGGFSDRQERKSSRPAAYTSSKSTTFDLSTVVFLSNQSDIGVSAVAGNSNTGNNVTGNAAASSGVGQSLGATGTVGKHSTDSSSSAATGSSAAQAPATVAQQPVTTASGQQVMVRTVTSGPSLPSSSLYVLNALNGNRPLVETDPAFTNYKNWLSSDYMLNALSADPSLLQKRLGDGFYEQQLIQQQVSQLTGRRFLGDYASNDEQYMALMQNGVTFAQEHDLRPGVSLSAAQVAQLTSDLVWLVTENITMPDGSVQTVLVPKVYVVARPGDLSATGTLLSGDTINVQTDGDVHNSGTIAGRRAVLIAANDINNIGGHIVSDSVVLDAQRDINVVGGTVSAALSLLAQAGNDINVVTTTRTTSGGTAANGYSNTVVDQVAGLTVAGSHDSSNAQNGVMYLNAGRDINLQAAQINNAVEDGITRVEAGNNVNLSTVDTSRDTRITWDAKNHLFFGGSEEVGTQINTQGSTVLAAGNDITTRAAQVEAAKDLRLNAGNDISIAAGESTRYLDDAYYHESSGMFGSSSKTTTDKVKETQALGSSVGGQTIGVTAGQNITVLGSNVVSDQGTTLQAGGDVNILAATETSSEEHFRKSTSSGLLSGGGIGFTIGSRKETSEQSGEQTAAAGSTVGSIEGNVTVIANGSYRQVGSDVVAPQGDVSVVAQDIAITEARQTYASEQHTKFEQSGLSVSLSAPVISMVQTASSLAETASKTSDGRMQALAAGAAALNVYNNAEALKNLGNGKPADANVSISITVGSSKSQSDSYQNGSTSQASHVQAGGNVNLIATGAGENSNLLVQGSDITAGKNATLIADNQVNLLASQDNNTSRSTNSSSSAAVGVAITVGQGGASFGFTASASKGKGHENSDDLVHNNTHVTSGDTVTIQSGGDTNLRGAVVSGNKVAADIGGDLNMQSLQDTSIFDAKQQNIGGSVTVGAGFSGSVSYSNSKAKGDFASVTEQTGIQAGDGGFDITVKGNTDLKGAVIASTQAAVDQQLNQLTTGTLTASNIDNHSDYSASSVSLSGGFSVKGDSKSDASTQGGEGGKSPSGMTLWNANKTGVNGGGIGASSDSGSDSSTTYAGISGAEITITDESGQLAKTGQSTADVVASIRRDVITGDGGNGLSKNWNGQQLMQEQAANAQIIAAFGQQASQAVGFYAQSQFNELKAKAEAAHNAGDEASTQAFLREAEAWAEGGAARVALHAVVGGLSGGVQGAAGATVSQLSIDFIGSKIAQTDLPLILKETLVVAAGASLGASVGGIAGGNSSFNAIVNNYLTVADLKKEKISKEELQNASLKNNLKIEEPCIAQDQKTCGQAIAQAVSDIGELKDYKEQLILERNSQDDHGVKASLTAQIIIIDKQINSANNAIRVAGMSLNEGNFTFGDMSDQELMAMGFAFDAIGAAELRSIGKASNLISTISEKFATIGKNKVAEVDAGSVKLVNPTNSMQNCTNCVFVVDNLLTTGNAASALPRGTPVPFNQLGEAFGTKFSGWVSQQSIEKNMLNRGEGTRAVIYGTDGATGHVWNAVVQNGKINYIDGQIGGSGAINFKVFNNFQFGILP